jgi:5'-3' exonuclease
VTADRLMVLDAPSLYFRAFFGVPESVTAPDGTPINAVRGLVDMTAQLVRKYRPQRLVACMDADWRPAFRVAALPAYKAHRVGPGGGDQAPEALNVQVPIIEQVLAAVGIPCVGVAGFEADDVIGTLAEAHGGPVDVVTGDRDLFQLVRDDKPVRVLYTARGVARLDVVDEAAITEKYGVPGRSYGEFAMLRGDPSDGLPGVPGVGEKTAAALVTKYGTAAEAAQHEPKVARHADYVAAAEVVVRVVTDVPLPVYDDLLPTAPADPEGLVALCDRWGLDSALSRLGAALAWQHGGNG